MSLHTTHRPASLELFYGNEETVAAVRGLLAADKPPRSWLFSGPSGCGKTTLGRIIARELGCTAQDLVEINASDARGIETARELIELCSTAPWGPARVVILDEVHQATKDFQNAILKLVEEPPPGTYLVLATTDPDKLLKTVVNRCQHFRVSLLPRGQALKLLAQVAEAEGVELPKAIAVKIHAVAEGCPRQMLVLLGRVVATDPDEWDGVVEGFKTEEAQGIELCRALAARKPWKEVAKLVKALDADPESVRRLVLGYFTAVALGGNEAAMWTLECFAKSFFESGKAGLVLACYSALADD